ncbi:MAG TPA: hypothetical protein VJJ23_05400 [Candidatus Nanoarchaeia archaeon]|nr:hypothetical protein [Candidatus Nanoarchaeia archaeon]
MISFEEFSKLDLRVAEILEVNDHPNADKLYVLKIDLGDEQRTLVAGLRAFYSKDELLNKKVIVLTNLEPKTFRGIESKGMLLAAEKDGKVKFLTVDIENGAKIR